MQGGPMFLQKLTETVKPPIENCNCKESMLPGKDVKKDRGRVDS